MNAEQPADDTAPNPDPTVVEVATAIAEALPSYRAVMAEKVLQRACQAALEAKFGANVTPEAQLPLLSGQSAHDRPDFMVGRIAVEVKVDGGVSPLIRQVWRYAEHDEVAAIVVVTTKSSHRNAAGPTFRNKPTIVVYLGGV